MSDCDVIVAGAGPAGLAAACLAAFDGWKVVLVTGGISNMDDPRTVALLQPAIRLLEGVGISLTNQTAPLRRLRLVDDTGASFKAPDITFDPHEIGEEVFGWNVPLALLLPTLRQRALALGVRMIDDRVVGAAVADAMITVKLAGGAVTGRVALAADGWETVLREAAGIATNAWSYDQMALATSFAHSQDHDGVSTEYHKAAGPFTTVPMPGRRSSLVWMERPARVAELMAMADAELAAEIQIATHGALGLISVIGPRKAFPMQGLVAREFAKARTLLMGEAGHVVPPIGAQGLNMSLRDASDAVEFMRGQGDPGSGDVLAAYDAARRRDVQPRQQVIDLMNRSLLSGFMPLEGVRAAGIAALARFGPLRRYVMKRGLGG